MPGWSPVIVYSQLRRDWDLTPAGNTVSAEIVLGRPFHHWEDTEANNKP